MLEQSGAAQISPPDSFNVFFFILEFLVLTCTLPHSLPRTSSIYTHTYTLTHTLTLPHS